MRPGRLLLPILSVLVLGLRLAQAQEADDAREQSVVERFAALLEKNPRRGTALDRVYGYHVERGTLDAFLKTYRDRLTRDANDGTAGMLIGLVEAQRGRDAAAVASFKEAEKARPDDPLPAYYAGQSFVLIGQPDQAALAFERALARKPARQDLLEIYQALGRVHQRAHRNDQALAVWKRLEAAFPDDARVQEQIADILAEEGQNEPALSRYEALATKVKDPYRQVQLRLQAAELKVRLGRSRDALTDFERLLSKLEPESWLAREVRRQVEDVFLRNDDLSGLSAYYQDWVKKAPEDVEALARLGRTLAQQGRGAEARPWLEKAVRLAPRRRELRRALIEQRAREKNVAEAEVQYEALSQSEPNNPDVIREWGRLVLNDPARPEAKRKQDAATIWKRLLTGREQDPVAVAQLADLYRQASLTEPALEQYRKAVGLAPDAPQYREYLGEYLHALQREPEALAAWRAIAEGPNRSARTLTRLAEVLGGFGHRAEALEPLSEAVTLQPDDFELRVKQADLLLALERYGEALKSLDEAARLADSDEARALVLDDQIRCHQGAGTLRAEIEGLQKDLNDGREATAPRWLRLARFLEADQKLPEAVAAARKAVALDERSVPAWTALARVVEAAGDLAAAVDAQRRLATLDRRGRADYLTAIAKLEARLVRREAALQAGRDLLAVTPGNPETHQFFADLCFQLGATDEGLDALRRAVRANPSDPKGLLTLADALAQQFRTDEATELSWRAFERTKELDEKLGIVAKLTDLSLQQNQFDKLLARLERLGQEPAQQRESVFCLAQAYSSSGDFGTARKTLERLLTPETRDPKLFEQLSRLSESEGDIAGAAKYLRQACDLAPDDRAWDRLAQLYLRSGDAAEAEAIWSRTAESERSQPARALQAIDSLLSHRQRETVLAITERLLRTDPKNWEALYREGVALAGLDRGEEAAKRFRALLDLRLKDDEEGALARTLKRTIPSNTTTRPAGTAASSPATTTTVTTRLLLQPTILSRHTAATYIRRIASLEYYPIALNWSPTDFGQARMAALGWLDSLSQKDKTNATFLKAQRETASRDTQDVRALWDWYYLELVRQENREAYLAARELTRRVPSDPDAQYAYLYALRLRTQQSGQALPVRVGSGVIDTTPPLDSDEIDHVLACYESLHKRRPEWLQLAMVSNITGELKRAGREKDEVRMLREAVETANDPMTIYSAMLASAQKGDMPNLLTLLDKVERTQTPRALASTPYLSMAMVSRLIAQTMAWRADAKAHGDILRLLDRFDAYQRRFQATGPRARASTPANQAGRNYLSVSTGGILRSVQIDFPSAVEAFDFEAIQIYRNAFELYRRDDLLSDLLAHVRAQREKGDDAQRLRAALALSALFYWNDQKDEAARVLAEAAEQAKNDPEIRLLLADLHERRNERTEALAILDSVEPLDNATMQRRETSALRVAVQAGNVERARLAAERLFGLRLDAETQVQLAGLMHQLGQHELAEAVLARARRQAGSRVAALVSLMTEYERQNQPDLAVQVAHQILRRGPSVTALNNPGVSSPDDAARAQALQVLSRSGKLKEMIARVEAQAKASPQSVALLQNLADYYRAANDHAKLRGTYEAIAKLRPDDAPTRLQVGLQLIQQGDAAAAVEHLRAAIKKDPSLFGRQFFQFDNAFRQANKYDELVALVEGIDVRLLGNYSMSANIAVNLMANEKTRDRGVRLYRKVWDAFPTYRKYLIQSLFNPQVWQLPEMYELARQAIIPGPDQPLADPWAIMDANTFSDGRAMAGFSRLLEAATRQGKTADLARDVEAALKRIPDWTAGKVLLAILQLREGKSAEAVAALKTIVADKKNVIPAFACWPIAQELETFPQATELAEVFYRRAMDEDYNNRGLPYPNHPARRLSLLYQRTGKLAEARDLLLKVASQSSDHPGISSSLNPGLNNARRASMLGTIAEQLLDVNAPAEAVRLLGEMMAEIEKLPEDYRFYPNREMLNTQYRRGIDRALQGLGPGSTAGTVASVLKPRPEAKAGGPVLDLILFVEPRELDRAAVTSLLALTLPKVTRTPEVRAEVEAALGRLGEEFPKDLSVQIVQALLGLDDGKTEAIERLSRLVEQSPLDDLPSGTKANARQRAEAARQIGLWLVARACWAQESVRASGDLFARRALEAARRQAENRWALAMLREWGQHDLDRGDRASAEARWSELLDLVLANPQTARPNPAPNTPRPAPAARAPMVPSLTLDRFEQAGQVARLATRQRMHALGLRALRASLAGGPPVAAVRAGQGFGATTLTTGAIRVVPRTPDGLTPDPASASVEALISDLNLLWNNDKEAPALDVYETLREVVMPRARPAEVFLYPGPRVPGNRGGPSLVGRFLCRWAVQADRVDALRKEIEARRRQPAGEQSAAALLGLLDRAETVGARKDPDPPEDR
jgi:tetratricopeptide (TPR) repeat protein